MGMNYFFRSSHVQLFCYLQLPKFESSDELVQFLYELTYKLDSVMVFYTYAHFFQVAFQHFQELDEHISYVATKVCHLGDQLEGVNTPRQRAVEAQKLMKYFNEFLDGELKSDVFTNSEKVSTVRKIKSKLQLFNNDVLNYKVQLLLFRVRLQITEQLLYQKFSL